MDPEFTDVQPTVEFVRIFNDLFDIFNSKHKFGGSYVSPHKAPLTLDNIVMWKTLFETGELYIESLHLQKSCDSKSQLIKSRKKAGFLGLIVAMKSFEGIFNHYVVSGLLKYVLTFKVVAKDFPNKIRLVSLAFLFT